MMMVMMMKIFVDFMVAICRACIAGLLESKMSNMIQPAVHVNYRFLGHHQPMADADQYIKNVKHAANFAPPFSTSY